MYYGLSSKFNFGKWEHVVYAFSVIERAENWLNTEEYDFRKRELVNKAQAIATTSEEEVEEAIKHINLNAPFPPNPFVEDDEDDEEIPNFLRELGKPGPLGIRRLDV